MVSSLEFAARYNRPISGLSSASFLSLSTAPIRVGGPDLHSVSRFSGAPVDTYAPVLRPIRSTVSGIGQFNVEHFSDGRFTEVTIRKMHEAVLAAKTDAKWRQMMEDIRQYGRRVGAVGWKDYLGEMRWFDHWYRGPHFIDYVRDPHQVEMVVHPMLTYMKQVGDCDDSSTLFGGSMGALGAAHLFRTYRADPKRPHEWSHVACKIWVPGHGWVNEDLTIRGAAFGWEPSGFEFKDWPEPKW
jgi:hypothetical protein